MIYNALTIREPYLQLIIKGLKTWEFRPWRPRRQGLPFELVLCAAKRIAPHISVADASFMGITGDDIKPMHDGLACARALVTITEIAELDGRHRAHPGCCFHSENEVVAWKIEDVRPIEPFPVTGRLGIFPLDVAGELRFLD